MTGHKDSSTPVLYNWVQQLSDGQEILYPLPKARTCELSISVDKVH